MSTPNSEATFLSQFWYAAEDGAAVAVKAQALIAPDMFADERLAVVYRIVSHRFALGEPIGLREAWADLVEAGATDAAAEVLDAPATYQSLMYHAERVVEGWQARKQIALLRLGLEEAEKSAAKPGRARKVAEALSMRLLETFASNSDQKRPQTRNELLDDQLDRMAREDDPGLTLPWPKMEAACGPWIPGEVVGITGYSGTGKSTFAANLAMGFARRGTPVIVFPMEMREEWVARSLCAESRVPQWIAEKGLWKKATPEQRAAYAEKVEEMRSWPWEVVNRARVSPMEILASVRTLRRNWPNKPVVVLVDHMHRLDYGKEEPDYAAGPATQILKNFASDEGVVMVLLYQPKKPEGDAALYAPIHASRIRGHSSVWNELNVHLSIFRSFVERAPFGRTPWGDPAGATWEDGSPKITKPFADGAQVDDEHVYLKPDKRRVGGEGPSFWLHIDKPSGQICERHNERAEAAA